MTTLASIPAALLVAVLALPLAPSRLPAQASGPRFINPPGLSRPTGYTHVVVSPDGRTAYIAGQVAYDSAGQVVGGGDFRVQAAQVFANLSLALASVGAGFRDVMKTTTYLTDLKNLPALREMAEGHVREVREDVLEYDIGGKRLNLVAEGRLVNLGAAEGHPAAVMDMSFANQALAAEYAVQHHTELEHQVYGVPDAIDAEVARLKLAAFGIELDRMTPEQAEYVASWKHGT